MRIASIPTLLLATVLSGPAIWNALVTHELEPRTALLRYLLAVPVAAAMLWVLSLLAKAAAQENEDKPRPPLRVEAVTGEALSSTRRRESDAQP